MWYLSLHTAQDEAAIRSKELAGNHRNTRCVQIKGAPFFKDMSKDIDLTLCTGDLQKGMKAEGDEEDKTFY